MSKRVTYIVVLIVVIAVAIGWYLFRPDALFIDKKVNETHPVTAQAKATILYQGTFQSGAHETKGSATIYQMPNGKRVLRLTQFKTSNGPDLRVYLVASNGQLTSKEIKTTGFFPLGRLKGNIGNQNYQIPAAVDLSKFHRVTIWCQRFGKNFGDAKLAQPKS